MAFWFIASLASCSASSWSLSVYRLVGLLFFVSSWLLSGLSPRRPLGSHCLVYRLVGLMFALVLFACWFIALSASCFTSSWLPSRLSPCWPRVLFSHLVVIFLVYRLLGLVFCTFLVASCFIALSALLFACSGLPFCLSPRRPCLQFSFVCFSGLSPRRPCLHSLVIYLIHIIACHHLFRLQRSLPFITTLWYRDYHLLGLLLFLHQVSGHSLLSPSSFLGRTLHFLFLIAHVVHPLGQYGFFSCCFNSFNLATPHDMYNFRPRATSASHNALFSSLPLFLSLCFALLLCSLLRSASPPAMVFSPPATGLSCLPTHL